MCADYSFFTLFIRYILFPTVFFSPHLLAKYVFSRFLHSHKICHLVSFSQPRANLISDIDTKN
jgi:hypothetical protein